MKARIFEIKKFAVHDGDGIRTTVFFKGCPLKCVWCHNPEGLMAKPQLAYLDNKCKSCGACTNVCLNGAHKLKDGYHIFNRNKCVNCGKCEKVCPYNALLYYGKEFTVEELLPILLEDKDFYDNTNGGVTLSGGECLLYADFCAELLKRLKEKGIHTAIDTCGYVNREAIDKVLPYTDIFLYDIKALDNDVHIKCTGQSNKVILENLQYIDKKGKAIEVRIPYVPEYNANQMEKIAKFLKTVTNLKKVKVLPYHNYAVSKYLSLGMKNTLPNVVPNEKDLNDKKLYFKELI